MDDNYAGGGLYIIWLSDKDYYGGRTNNFKRRICEHKRSLKRKTHGNQRMQNVYNLYGRFEVVILTRAETIEKQILAEQLWLDQNFGTKNCLNIDKNANGTTMAGIAKISKSLMLTDEQKRIKSERAIARNLKCSDETREKMRKAMTGKKHTDEAKQKMSAIQRKIAGERIYSEETKRRMSESQKKRWNEETRKIAAEKSAAIYEANRAAGEVKFTSAGHTNKMKGQGLPTEWVEKLSKASKARWTPEARAEASAKTMAINEEKRRLGIEIYSEERKKNLSEKIKETLRLKKIEKDKALQSCELIDLEGKRKNCSV